MSAPRGPARGRRRAWAEVDLGAIRANAAALREVVAPADLCAVVKANGYGHGAVEVAQAALAGGASLLAVALVEEGVELRHGGIDAPILLLSEPPRDPVAASDAIDADLTVTVYTPDGVERVARAAARAGKTATVHVKVDTGMHRVGASPEDAVSVVRAVLSEATLRLGGVWTHFACADEPTRDATTAEQLRRHDEVLASLRAEGIDPGFVHTANTAAALAHESSRRAFVRAGIGLYGYAPMEGTSISLTPAMSVKAEVAFVKTLEAGERVSYGHRYEVPEKSVVATVPLGYADGVPRRLGMVGGRVLIGGRRCPIAGTVTMDQFMVDCGPASGVAVGDEVVLIGRQGDEAVTADDWARLLDTISYEIVCGIGPRVPRVYV